jgi:hypothetical protein
LHRSSSLANLHPAVIARQCPQKFQIIASTGIEALPFGSEASTHVALPLLAAICVSSTHNRPRQPEAMRFDAGCGL